MPGARGGAASESDRQRDEIFMCDLTGAVLNPQFHQFLEAVQAPSDKQWTSWEEEEPAADEYTAQLERGMAVFESSGSSTDAEPSLQQLVEQLGLAGDPCDNQREVPATAPEVARRFLNELDAALKQQAGSPSAQGCPTQ
mmetsp:Transcript_31837/g.73891  ORF Transcript_31837/g.73891 Transcript_31837/m.73891 type:complete len:140 (+) Transcript_31837:105-524(+)